MADITDEFKIIVVDAIRSLCLKFPAKQAIMLSFLSGVLRDEGGYDFKHAVVEAIFDMIKFINDCREAGKYLLRPYQLQILIVLQPLLIYVSSSRTASLPSSPSEFCTFSASRALEHVILPSSSGTSTTEWCLKTRSSALLRSAVSPSLVFASRTRRS